MKGESFKKKDRKFLNLTTESKLEAEKIWAGRRRRIGAATRVEGGGAEVGLHRKSFKHGILNLGTRLLGFGTGFAFDDTIF